MRLKASETDRMLFGVCGGLAEWLDIDSIWIRLAFVLAFIFFSLGFWAYVILAVLMHAAAVSDSRKQDREDFEEIDPKSE